MKVRDLRELGTERLKARTVELKVEYEALKEAVLSGKEKNHARLAILRRDVARADTILKEKGGKL